MEKFRNSTWLIIFLLIVSLLNPACKQEDDPTPTEEKSGPETIVSGLQAPQGIEIDSKGRFWVANQGTGRSDGSICMVDPRGNVHPFLINLPSVKQEGMAGSAHHLLIDGEVLWATLGVTSEVPTSLLLKLNIATFAAGDPPLVMDDALIAADISKLTLNHPFINQTGESNIYNLCHGPSNLIYLVDAAANAVISFDKQTNEIKILAELPKLPNTGTQGPPQIDAVPTGITYHNGEILVSAFAGFPFTDGSSRIFRINSDGSASIYFDGLNGAVDLQSSGSDLFIVEYARFRGGFQGNSSRVLKLKGLQLEEVENELHFISGISIDANATIYLSSIVTGDILKITG